jgi:DNA-binding MarR family transcriptional regulator
VEHRPDPDDRRAKRIFRTARAKRATRAAIDAARDLKRELRQILGENRLDAVRGDLKRIVEAKGGTIKPPLDGID